MSSLNNVYATALGGLNTAAAQLAVTANKIATITTSTPTADGTGILTEIVGPLTDLVREQALYTANAAVIRAADRMTGTLLDVMDEANDRRR